MFVVDRNKETRIHMMIETLSGALLVPLEGKGEVTSPLCVERGTKHVGDCSNFLKQGQKKKKR